MSRQLRERLSYANVMATLAMFIALGGTSFAAVQLAKNSVRSPQIKNGEVKRQDLARNAINSAKVADGSLLSKDFKAGQLPAGPRGAQGIQGPQGAKGDPGLTTLDVRAKSDVGRAIASCPPGMRATGGGAHSVAGFVDASAPAADPNAIFAPSGVTAQGSVTMWTAGAHDIDGSPADITAWVVCTGP